LDWVLAIIGLTPVGWTKENWDRVFYLRRLVERIGEIKGWKWVNDYHRIG